MKCPVCNDVDLLLSERQGIEIDYCPACRGVWLDRGELDKIIERTAPLAGPEPHQRDQQHRRPEQLQQQPSHPEYQSVPPRYQQQGRGYGHGHGHFHKKKKSLLSELFDFD